MSSRQPSSSRVRKSANNVNASGCLTRKRKGRASTSTDENGNVVKKYCGESRVETQPVQKRANKLLDECPMEYLSLEADERLESPSKEPVVHIEKRRSLRSNDSKIAHDLGHFENYHQTKIVVDNHFSPIMKSETPLPQLHWADPTDVWERMKNREKDYKKDAYYLKRHPALQVKMRSILLDWLIEVCEVYRLHKETFHLAVDFVDRYLSCQTKIQKQRLQLIGVTSLFIAAKIEEIYPPKITEFAYVTDGACTVEEITKQELLILQALKWKLSPVTSNSWLTTYLQIANKKTSRPQRNKQETHFEFPKFPPINLARVSQLLDLCILDIKSLQFANSVIAASSLYHVIPNIEVTAITGYSLNELCECIQWLVPFHGIIKEQRINSIKHFDKIPADDAHNIQVHNSGIKLLDEVHEKMRKASTIEASSRTSPIMYEGILTPPSSTKKDY